MFVCVYAYAYAYAQALRYMYARMDGWMYCARTILCAYRVVQAPIRVKYSV